MHGKGPRKQHRAEGDLRMEEKRIRQQMRKIMIALVSSSLALFATVAGILWFMTDSLHESVHEQMQAEAREYISRIHKQIDKDFQTLHTLASFVEASEIGDLRTLADGMPRPTNKTHLSALLISPRQGKGLSAP